MAQVSVQKDRGMINLPINLIVERLYNFVTPKYAAAGLIEALRMIRRYYQSEVKRLGGYVDSSHIELSTRIDALITELTTALPVAQDYTALPSRLKEINFSPQRYYIGHSINEITLGNFRDLSPTDVWTDLQDFLGSVHFYWTWLLEDDHAFQIPRWAASVETIIQKYMIMPK